SRASTHRPPPLIPTRRPRSPARCPRPTSCPPTKTTTRPPPSTAARTFPTTASLRSTSNAPCHRRRPCPISLHQSGEGAGKDSRRGGAPQRAVRSFQRLAPRGAPQRAPCDRFSDHATCSVCGLHPPGSPPIVDG